MNDEAVQLAVQYGLPFPSEFGIRGLFHRAGGVFFPLTRQRLFVPAVWRWSDLQRI